MVQPFDDEVHRLIVGSAGPAELLAQLPHRRAVELAVAVRVAPAGTVVRQALGVVGVARGADPRRAVRRPLADRVVARRDDGEAVGEAFVHGPGDRRVHAADHPPDHPVTVLVPDDVGVEAARPLGVGERPLVHLHARRAAVAGQAADIHRRREVRVVVAGPVQHLGADVVAAASAPAEVVRLEVPGSLGEAVLVETVVDDVDVVEDVLDGGPAVLRRRRVEAEVRHGTEDAVRHARPARIGGVVGVAVDVGGDVVAGDPVRVLRLSRVEPAVRRRGAVRLAALHHGRVAVFRRDRVGDVAVVGRALFGAQGPTVLGDDAVDETVVRLGPRPHEVARAHRAVLVREEHEFGRGVLRVEVARVEHGAARVRGLHGGRRATEDPAHGGAEGAGIGDRGQLCAQVAQARQAVRQLLDLAVRPEHHPQVAVMDGRAEDALLVGDEGLARDRAFVARRLDEGGDGLRAEALIREDRGVVGPACRLDRDGLRVR